MPEYYKDEFVTLYHGEWADHVPGLRGADLLVTDPPYPGLVGGYRRAFANVGAQGVDSLAIGDPWQANLNWIGWMPHDIAGAVVFCSHHTVPEVAAAFEAAGQTPLSRQVWRRVALLTWWKRNAPPTGKNVPRFRSEFAWAFAREPGITWDGITDTVLDIPSLSGGCFATSEKTEHPTQKPVALMQSILSGLHPACVLDPFAGSGTTLVAAKNLNLRAIGIEREERYCEIAAQRLSQSVLDLGGVA